MRVKKPVRTVFNLAFRKAPLEAQLIVTRRCNLSCGYCTEYDNVSKPVPLETLKERIDAIYRLRAVNISILGGEPLMHPDIVEIVRYCNSQGQVSITTNAFLVEQPLIEQLNAAGLSNLEVSIDGLNADRTGYIQKCLKTLKPKLELLKKHATFDVHVNVVLCESTKDNFRETVEEIRKFGYHVSVDLFHEPNGMIGIQGPEYVKLWDEHFGAKKSFTAIDYDYGRALLLGEKPKWKCRAGSRFLYVDEFGLVQFCSSQRGRLNKPVTEYKLEDLRAQSKTYKGCEEGCSLLCMYRDSLIDNEPMTVIKGAIEALRNGVVSAGTGTSHA